MHHTVVTGVPQWCDARRLLGPGRWRAGDEGWEAELDADAAALLLSRLRGVHLDGEPLRVRVRPSLKRARVRAGRTADARLRRSATPGFTQAGTRLDDEGRVSLTPESLALALGRRHAGCTVVDSTCGAGGNAIGFARAGCEVIALDTEASRLEDARHNARQYGVADRITFRCGDALALVPELRADLLFIDPPWGVDWARAGVDIHALPPLPGLLVHRARFGAVVAKVPPSVRTATAPGAVPEAWFGERDGDRHRVKFVTLRWEVLE